MFTLTRACPYWTRGVAQAPTRRAADDRRPRPPTPPARRRLRDARWRGEEDRGRGSGRRARLHELQPVAERVVRVEAVVTGDLAVPRHLVAALLQTRREAPEGADPECRGGPCGQARSPVRHQGEPRGRRRGTSSRRGRRAPADSPARSCRARPPEAATPVLGLWRDSQLDVVKTAEVVVLGDVSVHRLFPRAVSCVRRHMPARRGILIPAVPEGDPLPAVP